MIGKETGTLRRMIGKETGTVASYRVDIDGLSSFAYDRLLGRGGDALISSLLPVLRSSFTLLTLRDVMRIRKLTVRLSLFVRRLLLFRPVSPMSARFQRLVRFYVNVILFGGDSLFLGAPGDSRDGTTTAGEQTGSS